MKIQSTEYKTLRYMYIHLSSRSIKWRIIMQTALSHTCAKCALNTLALFL